MSATTRYDLVAFDLDGTIIDDTVFVWYTLHEYFDTPKAARKKAFSDYMEGRINYQEWFEHDIEILLEKGANRATIDLALAGMKLIPGSLQTLEILREAGAYLVVISGSIDVVVERFGLAEYFDELYLNRLTFDEAGKLVAWKHTPYDVWDKAVGLREVAHRLGIPLEKTAYVGDNFNDVAVAKAAGFSVAFNCKSDELAEVSDVVVDGSDMRNILPYLLDNPAKQAAE